MQTIIIDEEFKGLLPALDRETYALLEENLLQNGCRDSLILWGDTLIDGHNRFEICTKHEIPFNTVSKEFESREDVIIWIISTQISRRNLTQKQLSNYRGLHYAADKKKQGSYDRDAGDIKNRHSDGFNKPTAIRLSGQYNVSPRTIERDAKFAAALTAIGEFSPEAKRLILTDQVKLDKKALVSLSADAKDEIEALAMAVEQGTYEKKKPEPPIAAGASDPAKPPAPAGPIPAAEPTKPADRVLSEIQLLNSVLGNVSDSFYSALPGIKKKAELAEIKAALKPCIDMLGDMYRQL